MFYLILVCVAFVIGTWLFQKAAGSLNPGKINIISYIYYIFMLQSFVGVALINFGFTEHYTLGYLIDQERSLQVTTVAVCTVAVLMPLVMLALQKLAKVDMRSSYSEFLKAPINYGEGTDKAFYWLFIAGIVAAAAVMGAYLIKIGYVPLLKLFFADADFNFATERVRISGTYVFSSQITNIMLFTVVPLLSYISFAYAMAEKGFKWKILFVVAFVLSLISKTYKFEKSPLVFHLMIFVLMFLILKGGIKLSHMVIIVGFMGNLILLWYKLTGYTGNVFDIYNGPLGRTLFTEVGTLAYCFDLFPSVFGFLGGRSFSPTVLSLIGMDPAEHLRSSKLVMSYYGSEKVYDGTAGVMNTLFVGEAYANGGYIGVIISIVWVAALITVLMLAILKMKKSPVSIAFLAVMTVKIGTTLEGGFCDFVYSFDYLFTILCFVAIYFIFEKKIISFKRKVKNENAQQV